LFVLIGVLSVVFHQTVNLLEVDFQEHFESTVALPVYLAQTRNMKSGAGPTHLELWETVEEMTWSARLGDRPAVLNALRSMHAQLVEHAAAEGSSFDEFSPTTARLLRTGQQRLLQLIEHAEESMEGADTTAALLSGVRAISVQFRRQARLERGVAARRLVRT
jgi:hypothetical protein